MKARQTSVQATPQTQRQVTALEAAGFGTGFTNITRLAIDRMYVMEVAMNERIESILVQSMRDDAGQFGADADLTNVDIPASYAAYDEALRVALVTEYPGADVTIRDGADRFEVNGMRDHREIPAVGDIVHEVWERFDWVVVDAEKLLALVATATVGDPTPIGQTSVVHLNDDGAYSVADNGEIVSGLDAAGAVRIVMENEGWMPRTE